MTAPFLTTKLNIPPKQPNCVSRLRLIERLDAGLHGRLTFISAPAGFGKTTLLSEWLHARVGSNEYKDEAAEFLNQVTGLNLSTADIDVLTSRTEGWITGLQLAALSMRGQDPAQIAGFIRAFTGSNRYVLDYLVEEVLTGLSDDIYNFLLKTSILDRLTGPLCDAVLDDDESRKTNLGSDNLPRYRLYCRCSCVEGATHLLATRFDQVRDSERPVA